MTQNKEKIVEVGKKTESVRQSKLASEEKDDRHGTAQAIGAPRMIDTWIASVREWTDSAESQNDVKGVLV